MTKYKKCVHCGSESAVAGEVCKGCKKPVCLMCAVYDLSGELWCPDCAEDAIADGGFDTGESGPDEGRWL